MHTKTLNRLQEQLLEYDFAIHYRKGIENSAADALSRNAVSATEQFLYTLLDESGNLASAQKLDPFIMDVRDLLVKNVQPGGSPGYKAKVHRVTANCFMDKGVIWYNLTKLGGQFVPVLLCPESMRFMVMDVAHCSPFSGHSGRQRTIDRVQLGYWWPGILYDIDNFLHKCDRCQELVGRKPISSPLHPLPTVGEQNARVHMDLFGPLRVQSANGRKYILVITDALTKYTELVALEDKRADTVARAFFESWVCRHGVPTSIVYDRGKEFLHETMKKLCEMLGVDHSPTSLSSPVQCLGRNIQQNVDSLSFEHVGQ